MRTAIKNLNEKSDNRFIYALGLICLLSICLSEFPEPQLKSKEIKSQIITADNNPLFNTCVKNHHHNA